MGGSTAVIESCNFLSNHAVNGGAMYVNQQEHVSVHSTSLLRNVASDTGGALVISDGTEVMINNITCVGNQGPNGGGCMNVGYVTLTLNNSDISENFGNNYGAGVSAGNSRIQVGAKFTNETRLLLLNANFYCKFHKIDSFSIADTTSFSTNKDSFISLVQSYIPFRKNSCNIKKY